jgi:hypothetical protein
MPWHNAIAPDQFSNGYIKALGVFSVPREFLVNEDGVIIATDEDLRGSKLGHVLQRNLKN